VRLAAGCVGAKIPWTNFFGTNMRNEPVRVRPWAKAQVLTLTVNMQKSFLLEETFLLHVLQKSFVLETKLSTSHHWA